MDGISDYSAFNNVSGKSRSDDFHAFILLKVFRATPFRPPNINDFQSEDDVNMLSLKEFPVTNVTLNSSKFTCSLNTSSSIQNEELESDFLNKTFIASSPKKGNTEQILFSESNSITRENGYSPDYGYDIMNTDNSCEDTLIYSNSSSETLINHSIHDNSTCEIAHARRQTFPKSTNEIFDVLKSFCEEKRIILIAEPSRNDQNGLTH